MDVLLLKTFLAVADAGSFSDAARVLGCVQSNVTARIRRLEDHLGRPLFERGRGGARLTDLGKRLYHHAVDVLARLEAAERDMLDAAGKSAPLAIGAMETTAAARLPAILKALRQQCPDAPLALRTAPTGELLSLLWDRKLDVAFVAGPVDRNRFRSIKAFREEMVVVQTAMVEPGDTLLAFRSGCSYRATAEAWLRSIGRSDTEIVEMGTLEGILGCVEAGMGFTVAPRSAVQTYHGLAALNLSRLPGAYGFSDTLLAWRIDFKPTDAHAALCRLL